MRTCHRSELAKLAAPLFLALAACAGSPEPSEEDRICLASAVPNDKSTSAPRPDHELAAFSFPGNEPEQTEYVIVHDDGGYDYVERWDIGIPGEFELEREVGWDWKVGCRMHVCPLPDGGACCHQICEDGGDTGLAYEPPDAFRCMNAPAGGDYHWFVEGLRNGGMTRLDACLEPTASTQ